MSITRPTPRRPRVALVQAARAARGENPADELPRIACHEAGHAVVALSLRREVQGLSVIPSERDLARATVVQPLSPRAKVLIFQGGMAGEEVSFGSHYYGASDERRIAELAEAACFADADLARLWRETLAIVKSYERAVRRLAAELVRHQEIDADQILAIWKTSPAAVLRWNPRQGVRARLASYC